MFEFPKYLEMNYSRISFNAKYFGNIFHIQHFISIIIISFHIVSSRMIFQFKNINSKFQSAESKHLQLEVEQILLNNMISNRSIKMTLLHEKVTHSVVFQTTCKDSKFSCFATFLLLQMRLLSYLCYDAFLSIFIFSVSNNLLGIIECLIISVL